MGVTPSARRRVRLILEWDANDDPADDDEIADLARITLGGMTEPGQHPFVHFVGDPAETRP